MGCIPVGRLLTHTCKIYTCSSCIQESSISMHKMSGGVQARTYCLFPLSRLQMKKQDFLERYFSLVL